jgi:hypothetical protein
LHVLPFHVVLGLCFSLLLYPICEHQ